MDHSVALGALIAVGTLFGISTSDDGTVSAAQAEALIQQCGYVTGPVTRAAVESRGILPWLVPPEPGAEPLMFFARDPQDVGRLDGRLFTVLVFPDEERAQRVYAAARGGPADARRPTNGLPAFRADDVTLDRGPILVQGAGPTVWRGSLTAFQLTVPPEPPVLDIAVQLRRQGAELATATPDQVRQAIDDARGQLKARSRDDLAASPYGVDRDFVDCLDAL
jgi:hypothetical protein